MSAILKSACVVVTLAITVLAAEAAAPPAKVNYQGVLRTSGDAPLTGTYDMVFSFWDAPLGGTEILDDAHLTSGTGPVQASNGLFSVSLGGGTVTDGPGPGAYTSLDQVFRDYANVFLQIKIGTEVLVPRTPVIASAYAMNASNLNGQPAYNFLDVYSPSQTKLGELYLDTRALGGISGLDIYSGGAGITALTTLGTGAATIADYDYGVVGSGSYAGGHFYEPSGNSDLMAAYGTYGLSATGVFAGGVFLNSVNSSTQVTMAKSDTGIQSIGGTAAEMWDPAQSTYAVIANGHQAIYGQTALAGYPAGQFFNYGVASASSELDGATGAFGLRSYGHFVGVGNGGGAYIEDFDNVNRYGYAYIGYNTTGIEAHGISAQNGAGGQFYDDTNSIHTALAGPTYGVSSNGAKNFVQNHPLDASKVIVYASLEGDEVGTYTRGSATLDHGEAHVRLGDTFQWVTNPDIGLTAVVTPRGAWADLYVASVSTTELIVRSRDPEAQATFDYAVYGLRIGFEDVSAIQEKTNEAWIPSRTAFDEMYGRHPELRSQTPLARFIGMRGDATAPLDLARSQALEKAIGVFDPARMPSPAIAPPGSPAAHPRARRDPEAGTAAAAAPPAAAPASDPAATPVIVPAGTFVVSEPVEAGDLLSLDPVHPGALRRPASASDPNVVGVAADASSEIDGTLRAILVETLHAEVRADATVTPIRAGDLVVSSGLAGAVMRAPDGAPLATIVGKAMEPLQAGIGRIRLALMAR